MPSLTRTLLPFLAWRDRVNAVTLRADLLAGVISALMVLPQGVAFATLAGLPPAYGLYAAMLPAIVGALWGSSWHLVSGPTNATSLMVYASLSALAIPFSDDYVRLALTLNLMLGVVKLALGVARLGALTNFISQTVVVGFTAGAALLIIAAQLKNFLGIDIAASSNFAVSIHNVASHIAQTDVWSTAVGATTLAVAIISSRLSKRAPHLLVGLLAGSLLGWWLNRSGVAHLATVGALPSSLPPFSLPDIHPDTWRMLAPACLALTLIGLTEAISSARAVALRSGQRLDANQEMIGQGLANVVGAFSSSYPSSGSFNRTGANYATGAQTPLAAVFSAFILLGVLVIVAPFAAFMPIAAMAGLLFLVAAGLIDIPTMRRIVRTSRAEALVLAVTFIATLTVQLEFAIFVGVLASLLVYLNRTTHPHLTPVNALMATRHDFPAVAFVDPGTIADNDSRASTSMQGTEQMSGVGPGAKQAAVNEPGAAQVGSSSEMHRDVLLLRVDGSLFFGAVAHVRDTLESIRRAPGAPRHIVLIGSGMNFIDVAGAEMLVQEARGAAESGIALYLCELKPPVQQLLERGGYLDAFAQNVFATIEQALAAIATRAAH